MNPNSMKVEQRKIAKRKKNFMNFQLEAFAVFFSADPFHVAAAW